MALKDTWVNKTRDDYNNEQIPNELAAAIIELEKRGGGEAQGLPLKKVLDTTYFLEDLENNAVWYVSVGTTELSGVRLKIYDDFDSDHVNRWGIVFTVGTSDFELVDGIGLKWAAADPIFTQGSTYRISIEKVGNYYIAAWDEVTI